MAQQQQQWKCLNCDKTFTVHNGFICSDGVSNHVVSKRTYLTKDAPNDPGHCGDTTRSDGIRREGLLRVCNIPPDRTVIRNGEASVIPGGYVEFARGKYETTDPEKQYFIGKWGGFSATYAEDDDPSVKDAAMAVWEDAWLSPPQKMHMDRMRLTAERQRLEEDRNRLLADVKSAKVSLQDEVRKRGADLEHANKSRETELRTAAR